MLLKVLKNLVNLIRARISEILLAQKLDFVNSFKSENYSYQMKFAQDLLSVRCLTNSPNHHTE